MLEPSSGPAALEWGVVDPLETRYCSTYYHIWSH